MDLQQQHVGMLLGGFLPTVDVCDVRALQFDTMQQVMISHCWYNAVMRPYKIMLVEYNAEQHSSC